MHLFYEAYKLSCNRSLSASRVCCGWPRNSSQSSHFVFKFNLTLTISLKRVLERSVKPFQLVDLKSQIKGKTAIQ